MNTDRRALLIHQGAVGDFIVACRLIDFSNELWGTHRWSYLGKSSHGRLAMGLSLIETFEDFDRPEWCLLFSTEGKIPDAVTSFLGSFKLIVNVLTGPKNVFARRLESASRGRVVHIDPKLPDDFDGHVLEYLTGQIPGGPVRTLPESVFQVHENLLAQARSEGAQRLVLFHPGASNDMKRIPMDDFIGLMADSPRRGIVLGEVELDRFSAGDLRRLESMGRMFVNLPLENVAGLLAVGEAYVGHDSGLSHLAGAVGTPSTVIFRRPNWKNWRPLGPKIQVVYRP